MKYDKPLIAAAIGAFSTIPYEIFTRILKFLGIGKYSLYELDSLIVTITNRPNLIIGIVISLLIGTFFAVLFYYAFQKLGTDYMLIKSIIIGLTAWAILEFALTSTIEGKTFPVRPINDYYVHMLGSIIFGVTFGLLFDKFLNKQNIPNK